MKYYSGMVIHSNSPLLYEEMTNKGMKLDNEVDSEGNDSYRQVGYSNTNPLQLVSDWILENEVSMNVTLEETVDGASGSLGDIFTTFTYKDGICVDVYTEWVEC